MFRKPGDPVVLRGAGFGKIWWALPVTVIQDSPELIALYWRAGVEGKGTNRKPAPQDVISPENIYFIDWTWKETDVLYLAIPMVEYAIYLMWETGSSRLRCWYINLQTPLRRLSVGFETMDQMLDVVTSPDRSKWWWKDEDEFNTAVALGIFSAAEAKSIRQAGERAIKLLMSGQSIYEDWQNWTAPTNWEIPKLPTGWDSSD